MPTNPIKEVKLSTNPPSDPLVIDDVGPSRRVLNIEVDFADANPADPADLDVRLSVWRNEERVFTITQAIIAPADPQNPDSPRAKLKASWDGRDGDGLNLLQGDYTIRVETGENLKLDESFGPGGVITGTTFIDPQRLIAGKNGGIMVCDERVWNEGKNPVTYQFNQVGQNPTIKEHDIVGIDPENEKQFLVQLPGNGGDHAYSLIDEDEIVIQRFGDAETICIESKPTPGVPGCGKCDRGYMLHDPSCDGECQTVATRAYTLRSTIAPDFVGFGSNPPTLYLSGRGLLHAFDRHQVYGFQGLRWRTRGETLDLREVTSENDLPREGRSLVVVALVNGKVYLRIFDKYAVKFYDKGENDFPTSTVQALEKLKTLIRDSGFPLIARVFPLQRQEIVNLASDISGYADERSPLVGGSPLPRGVMNGQRREFYYTQSGVVLLKVRDLNNAAGFDIRSDFRHADWRSKEMCGPGTDNQGGIYYPSNYRPRVEKLYDTGWATSGDSQEIRYLKPIPVKFPAGQPSARGLHHCLVAGDTLYLVEDGAKTSVDYPHILDDGDPNNNDTDFEARLKDDVGHRRVSRWHIEFAHRVISPNFQVNLPPSDRPTREQPYQPPKTLPDPIISPGAPQDVDAGDALRYMRSIYIEPSLPRDIRETALDLADCLVQVAGRSYHVHHDADVGGIFLVSFDSRLIPPAVKTEAEIEFDLLAARGPKSKEAFYVQHDDVTGRLWIIGRGQLGIPHGIYTYLNRLGFRWYFPGYLDTWKVTPEFDLDRGIRLMKKVGNQYTGDAFADSPAYLNRQFSGTGGFGSVINLGPNECYARTKPKMMERRWENFKRRNRFGGELHISGHMGETFVADPDIAATLHDDQYPEYRAAGPDGRDLTHQSGYDAQIAGRRPFSTIHDENGAVKLCTSNQELQELWTDWQVKRYWHHYGPDPEGHRQVEMASVEPSDGGGHCECRDCRLRLVDYRGRDQPEEYTISERVFHLANKTAEKFQKYYPDRYVSLLAYAHHSKAPEKFDLKPNVFVMLIPAIQYADPKPEDEFIAGWKAKHDKLGIGHYWGSFLPDIHYQEKDGDNSLDKIRKWSEQHKLLTFHCETTHGIGSVGLAWHLASHLLWTPGTDLDATLDDFFTSCFGPVADPPEQSVHGHMREMILRWSEDDEDWWQETLASKQDPLPRLETELPKSLANLKQALALCGDDEPKRRRVADYALFVEHLRFHRDYIQAKRALEGLSHDDPAVEEFVELLRSYVRYLWRIYQHAVVDTYRLTLILYSQWNHANPLFDIKRIIDWDAQTITYRDGGDLVTRSFWVVADDRLTLDEIAVILG